MNRTAALSAAGKRPVSLQKAGQCGLYVIVATAEQWNLPIRQVVTASITKPEPADRKILTAGNSAMVTAGQGNKK